MPANKAMPLAITPQSGAPLTSAVGSSGKEDGREAGLEAALAARQQVPDGKLALVFASAFHDQRAVLRGVREGLGPVPLIGGSSAAEISAGRYATRSVVVTLIGGGVSIIVGGAPYGGDPRRAATAVARDCLARAGSHETDLAFVMCSTEGGAGSAVVAALKEVLGEGTLLFGGGTGYREEGIRAAAPSCQYLDDQLIELGLVLLLLKLERSDLVLATSVAHGLQPISQPVVCTRAEAGYVHEIDGENVFTFYERYLGRKVEDVGPFVFTYPLLVWAPGQEQPLVRVPFFLERDHGRIGFHPASPVAGQPTSLAHFSRAGIVRACREAAYNVRMALGGHRPRLVLAVSCAARQLFLGPRVALEARIVEEVFGRGVPVAGFYSGGEIAPHSTRVTGGGQAAVPGAAPSQIVAQTFCLLAIGDTTSASAAEVAIDDAVERTAARQPSTPAQLLDRARVQIVELRKQIRESEALLELREQVLLRINRENIDVSRQLAQANRKLAEQVTDYVLGRRVGRFVIESFLGAGGGGNVYRARQVETNHSVALKLLPKNLSALQEKRFRREVEALRALSDRHVVPYVEASLERPLPFLAMGLVDGQSLEQVITQAHGGEESGKGRAFPLGESLRLATGIARGLAAAHAGKILHRDLKPANVIVDSEKEAVLIDFGLARDGDGATVTVQGEVIGTVSYFSPEHVSGRARTPASDVYQWGLIVFEMLTGSLPYPSLDGWASVMERFEKGATLPRFTEAPLDALARLAERALSPSPRRRPASGAELLDAMGVPTRN